ncbi:MAG: GNAT family N-acetyltransferase [Candidatus Heimdallarchaeota archaeon]
MEEKDYEEFRSLFEEAYSEYLESLSHENPQQYLKELQERKEVTRARFEFYFQMGSCFVAEEDGRVVGYVASQLIHFMHGVDKPLWIEYIVAKFTFRWRGISLVLLHKLISYAKHSDINRIYTTIDPDNQTSIKLHRKASFNIQY